MRDKAAGLERPGGWERGAEVADYLPFGVEVRPGRKRVEITGWKWQVVDGPAGGSDADSGRRRTTQKFFRFFAFRA